MTGVTRQKRQNQEGSTNIWKNNWIWIWKEWIEYHCVAKTTTSQSVLWIYTAAEKGTNLKSMVTLVLKHPAGTSVISSLNDKINNFCPTF